MKRVFVRDVRPSKDPSVIIGPDPGWLNDSQLDDPVCKAGGDKAILKINQDGELCLSFRSAHFRLFVQEGGGVKK